MQSMIRISSFLLFTILPLLIGCSDRKNSDAVQACTSATRRLGEELTKANTEQARLKSELDVLQKKYELIEAELKAAKEQIQAVTQEGGTDAGAQAQSQNQSASTGILNRRNQTASTYTSRLKKNRPARG